MLKITYSGYIPEDYIDGGSGKVTFYVDYNIKGNEIEKLARYDCNQLNDCTFIKLDKMELMGPDEKPTFWSTIYLGIELEWDNYFKEHFPKYVSITYDDTI